MSWSLDAFLQRIIQQLDGLYRHLSQLAAKLKDANEQLYLHVKELLFSDISNIFTGNGATAFANLASLYLDISAKHERALNGVSNAIYICYSDIIQATDIASRANLHYGLTNKILAQISDDDILQMGGTAIWEVIYDLTNILDGMKNMEGDVFGNVFSAHLEMYSMLQSKSSTIQYI